MRNLTVFPMHSFKGKIAGIIISLVAMVALVIMHQHPYWQIFSKLNHYQHMQLFVSFALFGLAIICFSKEKIDDERVRQIRAKALQMAFGLQNIVMIAVYFNSILLTEPMDGRDVLPMFCGLGLIAYLFFFHIALYFDSNLTYNDDTVSANIKKNKTFFIIYLILSIIMLLLIAN